MRSSVVFVAVLWWAIAAGCGGPPDDGTTTPRERRARGEAGAAEPKRSADYDDENSVGMADRRVKRWRWKGTRKDCFFVVGNRCFETKEEACKAAGCKRTRDCDMDDSAPVQVSCPKAKKSR